MKINRVVKHKQSRSGKQSLHCPHECIKQHRDGEQHQPFLKKLHQAAPGKRNCHHDKRAQHLEQKFCNFRSNPQGRRRKKDAQRKKGGSKRRSHLAPPLLCSAAYRFHQRKQQDVDKKIRHQQNIHIDTLYHFCHPLFVLFWLYFFLCARIVKADRMEKFINYPFTHPLFRDIIGKVFWKQEI